MASSLGTFLDVSQSSRAPQHTVEGATSDATAQAAQVLNAIAGGATTFADIVQRTGLDAAATLDALSYLNKAKLISVAEGNGVVSAALTPDAVAALNPT
jgi:predicted Rossmann fold nucleotide-binding protein DprA/Smf involved in DNA uptake